MRHVKAPKEALCACEWFRYASDERWMCRWNENDSRAIIVLNPNYVSPNEKYVSQLRLWWKRFTDGRGSRIHGDVSKACDFIRSKMGDRSTACRFRGPNSSRFHWGLATHKHFIILSSHQRHNPFMNFSDFRLFVHVFRQELASAVDADPDLQEEAGIMHHVLTQLSRYQVSPFDSAFISFVSYSCKRSGCSSTNRHLRTNVFAIDIVE